MPSLCFLAVLLFLNVVKMLFMRISGFGLFTCEIEFNKIEYIDVDSDDEE